MISFSWVTSTIKKQGNWSPQGGGSSQGLKLLDVLMKNSMTQWITENMRLRNGEEWSRMDLVLMKESNIIKKINQQVLIKRSGITKKLDEQGPISKSNQVDMKIGNTGKENRNTVFRMDRLNLVDRHSQFGKIFCRNRLAQF